VIGSCASVLPNTPDGLAETPSFPVGGIYQMAETSNKSTIAGPAPLQRAQGQQCTTPKIESSVLGRRKTVLEPSSLNDSLLGEYSTTNRVDSGLAGQGNTEILNWVLLLPALSCAYLKGRGTEEGNTHATQLPELHSLEFSSPLE
jgi:hypothetical protein